MPSPGFIKWLARRPSNRLRSRAVPFTKVGAAAWLLACWLSPAFLAQCLGWHAVWGGPRVFADYAMPFPISGGFFHVMTLAVVLAVIGIGLHVRSPFREMTPAGLAAMAGTGAVLLLDVGRWYLEQTTDLPKSATRIQQNPVGLFLLNDALFGFVWLVGRSGVWPRRAPAVFSSFAIALLPALATARLVVNVDGRATASFVFGTSIMGLARGDAAVTMFTRMKVTDPSFRNAAVQVAAPYRPQGGEITDQAVFFMISLDAARNARDGFGASATYCMYDDGTPPVWHDGYGDCFSGHQTLVDIQQASFEALLKEGLPDEVAAHLARRAACRTSNPEFDGRPECLVDQTERVRDLLTRHGNHELARARLEASLAQSR